MAGRGLMMVLLSPGGGLSNRRCQEKGSSWPGNGKAAKEAHAHE